jgi:hypothetical protein
MDSCCLTDEGGILPSTKPDDFHGAFRTSLPGTACPELDSGKAFAELQYKLTAIDKVSYTLTERCKGSAKGKSCEKRRTPYSNKEALLLKQGFFMR